MDLKNELQKLALTVEAEIDAAGNAARAAAGQPRYNDASVRYTTLLKKLAALRVTIDLVEETDQWAACLKCPLAFPTNEQLSHHYHVAHRH